MHKADEFDIETVVKYTHEKLDTRHVLNKEFDKLPFNLLVAGVLELAAQEHISKEERMNRILMAKTICYHRQYLRDEDLRNGYDSIIKKVEQGLESWKSNLGELLHQHYDYRTNIIMRTQIQERNNEEKWKSGEKNGKKEMGMNEGIGKQEGEKPIFCMEFNKGECPQPSSHQGNFGGQRCIKWHICRKCLCFGEFLVHTEVDRECSRREEAT